MLKIVEGFPYDRLQVWGAKFMSLRLQGFGFQVVRFRHAVLGQSRRESLEVSGLGVLGCRI